MRILTLENKPLEIFGQPMFPLTGGTRFNAKLSVLEHTSKCKGHPELAQFYADLSKRGFRNSDDVVNYIKALEPRSVSSKDIRFLDQAVRIPMKRGLVVHLDIAGEAAVKSGKIRESISSDEPATIPFTPLSQRPAWLVDNGQVKRADAA